MQTVLVLLSLAVSQALGACNPSSGSNLYTGLYIATSIKGVKELIMKDGVSSNEADEMLSYMAFRITEENGVYTTKDIFGTGYERTVNFSLGEEFQNVGSQFEVEGTSIFTETSPGKWTFVHSDVNGHGKVWKAAFTENDLVWTLNDGEAVIHYRRVADPTGEWKVAAVEGEELLRNFGMDEATIQKLMAERYSITINHVGSGLWEWESFSKVMPSPKLTFRFDEEFEVDFGAVKVKEVCTQNKDGMTCVADMSGVLTTYHLNFFQSFMIQIGRWPVARPGRPPSLSSSNDVYNSL